MEYIVLNLKEATEEQLRAAIDCNNRTYRLMTSEIAKLKKVAESTKKVSVESTEEQEPVQAEPTRPVVDEDFENEVDYYYSTIKELTLDNIYERIGDALPSRKNYQYERILLRIKAEIIRNIKDIRDFLADEDVSLEDAEELKAEIALEYEKLNLINKRLTPREETTEIEEDQDENNIIFVPTTGGNIRVLDEIDHIDQDYYDRFNGLFQSIKDGTFKNVKRFSRNSDLAGLCEVKDFKTRVIFVRLNSNSYAVISAFIKKSDNDKGYRNMLSSRYGDYQEVEDSLIANLENPEFMELQKGYEKELFRKLAPTEKEGPIVFTKVGE